jgi:AraC-like DNA-binding protein
MAYVREVRLERARADLMSDDPSLGSVTDIALKWGFAHLGRFAVEYKRRFGESPSATLRFRAGPGSQGQPFDERKSVSQR